LDGEVRVVLPVVIELDAGTFTDTEPALAQDTLKV
jgi:hypothetical protein